MRSARRRAATALAAVAALLFAAPVRAQDPGITADAIKLGNTAPYSGPASAYGTLVRAEAAYFRMINEQGGINGRRIEFLSLDDGYVPSKTVEQTRKLIEQEQIFADFSPVGTAPNIAIHKYLNLHKVPQLFVNSGASRWNDAAHFPWTIGYLPTYAMEGRVYAQFILRTKPDARIAVLTPNEDAGRDYLRGFKEGLGEHRGQIVAEATYETTDATVDQQIVAFQSAGADVFFNEATPKFAAQAIRKAAALGWAPLIILPTVSNSVAAVLKPAGLTHSVGIVTGAYLKDPNDPRWADDAGMAEWRAWMRRYYADGDPADVLNVNGYTAAQLMALVLTRCGGDLSRANVMRQASTLAGVTLPMLLPGIRIDTSPTDVTPIHQLQMARFDGKSWVLFGDVIGP